ncbi:hypothetical protein [Rhodococcoides fascians]|uniref:hypothetical protein n=1 Tax=Rhodococcoides fascians TaxID=1828 RepID=UPI0012D34AFF|nr:hypothetical protein [Rhodococcus fascians]MDJ0411212.1 hypothetical protein [Rhodococcus fascians]
MASGLNRLTIVPGDYPCEWQLPNTEGELQIHSGTVKLTASRSPSGTIYGLDGDWTIHPESGETSAAFPQYHFIPVLRGRLIDQGLDIAMIGAQITIMGQEMSWVRASAAVAGVDLPPSDDFRFLGAEVQFTALDVLGGQSPLASVKHPRNWVTGEWTVRGNGDSKQVWSDSEIQISHEYNMTARMSDPYEFRLRYTPVMRFDRNVPVGVVDWVERWIEPLRNVASIATGRTERITYLGLLPDLHVAGRPNSVAQVFAAGIGQQLFHSKQDDVTEVKTSLAFSDVSPIDLLRMSLEAREAGNPLLLTYTPSMMGTEQHPRGRYLFAMQCLESLYGFENRAAIEVNQHKYDTKREAFFEHLNSTRTLSSSTVNSKDWQFAKSAVGRRATSGLDTALRQLIDALPASPVKDELEDLELVDEVRTALLAAEPTVMPPTPENVLRMVRNDLAHGTRDHPAGSLAAASEVLHRIIRAHLLRILGCGHGEQQRALNAEDR